MNSDAMATYGGVGWRGASQGDPVVPAVVGLS